MPQSPDRSKETNRARMWPAPSLLRYPPKTMPTNKPEAVLRICQPNSFNLWCLIPPLFIIKKSWECNDCSVHLRSKPHPLPSCLEPQSPIFLLHAPSLKEAATASLPTSLLPPSLSPLILSLSLSLLPSPLFP
ncbi:hypothetical protein LEMLEM_LOCUS23411, partial [Lemmus lemmus]